MSEKFKISDKITVSKAGGSGSKAKRPPRRGLLEIDPEQDYQARRSQPGVIEIYDLGQLLDDDGVPHDLRYQFEPELTLTPFPISNQLVLAWADYELSNYTDLYNLLHAVPVDEWKDNYLKIDQDNGYKYGISVYQGVRDILTSSSSANPAAQLRAENPAWIDGAIKPEASWIRIQPTGGLAQAFDTNDTTNFKMTATRSYAAAEVLPADVDLSKGGKVFLVPYITSANLYQRIAFDAAFRRVALFGYWTILSRQLFLDKTIFRYFEATPDDVPFFQGYFLAADIYRSHGIWMFDEQHIGDGLALEITNWIRSLPVCKMLVQRSQADATFGYESPSGFPFPAASSPTDFASCKFQWYNFIDSSFNTSGVDDSDIYTGAGRLCGVVQDAAGSTFYVWSRTENAGQPYWAQYDLRSPLET